MSSQSVASVLERLPSSRAGFVEYLVQLLKSLDAVEVLEGDIDRESLELEEPLVVLGSLRVTGNITAWEHAHLIVMGDLRAAALGITGALCVCGSVEATLVYLCSGNDYRTVVEGDLRTSLVVEAGMRTSVRGACSGTIVSMQNRVDVGGAEIPDADDPEQVLRERLPSAWFEPDMNGNGGLHENLLAALSRGWKGSTGTR